MTVSALNELARESLQASFEPEIWVKGEIHGFKLHAKSGHLYFDLVEKAPGAQDGYMAKVSCAFFRGPYMKWRAYLATLGIHGFELNSGIEVKLKARIDLFVKEGRFQLIVSEIDPSFTFGAIAKKREQTILMLRTQGLFEKNKALSLPELPLNIGLVTSHGSAAFSDFMRVLNDSGYAFSITLFDAHMQGENTVPEVVKGIRALQKRPYIDAIALIRGGGAKTDLFSFDDISICTAVAQCPVPVITGIGHEIDVSVADLVANTYCVTPTDVARFFVAKADMVQAFLDQAGREIAYQSRDSLRKSRERLYLRSSNLGHIIQRWAASAHAGIQAAAFRLHASVTGVITERSKLTARHAMTLKSQALMAWKEQARVVSTLPVNLGRYAGAFLDAAKERVCRSAQAANEATNAALKEGNDRIGHLDTILTLLDPAETLKRGFSITVNAGGVVVRDASQVETGETITTKLMKGKIRSVVKDKE